MAPTLHAPPLPVPVHPDQSCDHIVTFIWAWSSFRLLLVLVLGMAATLAHATTCANAIVINPASLPITNQALVCGSGNDLNATNVPGAICGSGSGDYYKGGKEALYRFTPTTTASYQLSYVGQTWSAAMVYIGCPTLNNCLYGAGQTGTSVSFAVTLNAGITYYIWFDTWPSPASPCPGTFSLGPPPPPPANDNPCQATSLTVNPTLVCTAQTPGSLVGATPTTAVPTTPCGGTPNDDVWFSFIATGPTHYVSLNNVSGSPTDLYHALYRGTSCSSLINIGCSDNDNSVVSGLVAGSTYWVRVYSWSSSSGATTTFKVCIGTPPPPPPAPPCGGIFYDSGGASGNYPASAAQTTTICPSTPGDMVSLIFTKFDTESNYDQLRIYDGNSTAGTLLGTFSGNTLPPVLTATNPTGCLTAVFTSDGSVQKAGWAAQVLCAPLPAGDCVYVLHLHDSGGNGWGTSTVGVRINGGPYTYHTVTAADKVVFIGMNLGDLIELNYTINAGPNQNQNSYSISKVGQTPYFSSISPPIAGPTFSQIVTCGPPPALPQDCLGGITLCSSQAITNTSSGTGDVVDLNSSNQGCLSTEKQGTWYYFSPQTTGNIGFSIAPANGTDDYDFAVWGPFTSAQCPTGPPLRCSWNAPPSHTVGLGNGAEDTSEGADGDGWVSTIDAQAGDVYVLYIDNWSTSGQAFTLSWQLSGGTSLDCTTLPVEFLNLEATAHKPVIHVTWATATEQNTSHYIVERSRDNEVFTPIGTMQGAGNSQFRRDYIYVDEHPYTGMNYYRLQQVDLDGNSVQTHTVTAQLSEDGGKPTLYPNPATEMLNVAFNSHLEGSAVLLVEDALGRTIAQSTTVVLRGEHKAEVSLAGLATGWYNLRIALPDGSMLQGGVFLKQ